MPDPAHVGRHGLVLPAFASQDKAKLGRKFRGTQEKIFHTFLAVRQAVADKRQVTGEALDRWRGMVRVRVMGVVDRMTVARTEQPVMVNDRSAAAVGEDEVILRDE